MTEPIWTELGVPSVINAAGKMTYLGSSSLAASVAEAMASAGSTFVDIRQLKTTIGAAIAERLGMPGAWVVGSAAAGIVQCVAGAITGEDVAAVEAIPDVDGPRRNVVICKGHAVHFGAPLTQMIRLGGGTVHEVGSVNRATTAQVAAAVDLNTAAVVYVVSHHAAAGVPRLDEIVAIAHASGAAVIVDAAAETDLGEFVGQGADAAIYSGHKAIGGPTSGLVVGTSGMVAACAAQDVGVGRAMKVGKETLAGALAAVMAYLDRGARSTDELERVVTTLERTMGADLPGTVLRVVDGTRAIPRLRVQFPATSLTTAKDLVSELESGSPSIRTRNHGLEHGVVDFDPRELSIDQAVEVGNRVRAVLIDDAGRH